ADYRNSLVAAHKRQGRTLAVNWPLWRDGGMHIDTAAESRLTAATGIVPMRTATGIQALYRGLASAASQMLVMEGDIRRLQSLLDKPAVGRNSDSVLRRNEVDGSLEQKTADYLKNRLSAVLRIPVHKIHAAEPMESYGIDSIMVLQLTDELEKTFGPLSKTLFFEYQTLTELSRYFAGAYEAVLREILAPEQSAAPVATTKMAAQAPTPTRRSRFAVSAYPLREPAALDIAIIGLSGRYPEARNLDSYWKNLRDGKDCIIEIPQDRWDWRAYYTEDRSAAGGHFSKWGGFIADMDKFDPLFFNISPREAVFMDPQERLFLEHAWMAIEDAGYCPADLERGDGLSPAGVYAGVMYGEYPLFSRGEGPGGDGIGFVGNQAGIANRVSYLLNLHGPSMAVDTMCSSSLTSLHLACQDLKHGLTGLAIAGGVNISSHPNKYSMLSGGQFISTRGRCESFGAEGEGYIPAEGVGVAVLKRLADAERDGDRIYGVIKGSAINHGGKTNGYSVPNPNAQQRVIAKALQEAGIDPRAVSYIEAHGTGTPLGDPIEITGLTKAFGQSSADKPYCWIGSAKSNIGHAESAAGIAGVTKVLLQMQHGQIAPSLHSERLNPHIDFAATPFIVNQQLRDWQRPVVDGKLMTRIAGVSSFGAGGSNVHLVIEEYAGNCIEPADIQQTALVVLSAKDEQR
ncbi:MAG: polyketide synthase of type I, partial [Methylovulum sp.]